MNTQRLEAFSDGVIAIIITIMVLELKVPHGAELTDLLSLTPTFLAYVLSFRILGSYWNNHHNLFKQAKKVTPKIMWANLHLLFWLSLIPFFTAWFGENFTKSYPTALYGVLMLVTAFAFQILQKTIIKKPRQNIKGKLSLLLYVVSIFFAFINSWISISIFVIVALMWFIPNRHFQKSKRVAEGI